MPTSGNIDNNTNYYISRPYYAWYAQDNWKVDQAADRRYRSALRIPVAYLERYNRMSSQFDISTVNPLSDQILAEVEGQSRPPTTPPIRSIRIPTPPAALYGVWRFAGKDGYPRRTHYTDFTTGAPRIGFAYRLSDKTVIRGGVGMYYQSDTQPTTTQTGFSQSTAYTSPFNVNGSPMPLGLLHRHERLHQATVA